MIDLFTLKNKVIIVTGGTGVLGRSFVRGIANAGGTVIVIGQNQERANAITEEVNNNGGTALSILANVLDPKSTPPNRDMAFIMSHS